MGVQFPTIAKDKKVRHITIKINQRNWGDSRFYEKRKGVLYKQLENLSFNVIDTIKEYC